MSMLRAPRSRDREKDAEFPVIEEADLTWRHDSMGRLLNIAVRFMQARVVGSMHDAGHSEMRLAHVNLTRNLDLSGNTITELASRAAMTKQAMGELAEQCEKIGIVERTADPNDRRARIIRFTPEGLKWLRELRKSVVRAEQEMVRVIGAEEFAALKATLKKYNEAESQSADPAWNGPLAQD